MTDNDIQIQNTLPAAPVRPTDAHKGTFGSVLIIGGSRGMSGAAALAGMSALRSGTGLVTLAVPHEILPTVAGLHPSYMTIGLLEDNEGCISSGAQFDLLELASRYSAVAIGPGIGQSDGLQQIVAALYSTLEVPLVLDADALNLLANIKVDKSLGERILTPHPGEFSRLTGLETSAIQASRQEHAVEYARTHDVTLLLKGHQTIITNGQTLAINKTGNSGMATGGSGDVLTGLITGLLAQGTPAFEAAWLGAHLHGLAGDIAADELTEAAMNSLDLVEYLPFAWDAYLSEAT